MKNNNNNPFLLWSLTLAFFVILSIMSGCTRPSFIYCEDVPQTETTLEMELITGTKVTETFTYPTGSTYKVQTSKGAYRLEVSFKNLCDLCNVCPNKRAKSDLVQAGVIYFKIINTKHIQPTN